MPTQFNIFNQVFVNSSPPDAKTLQRANDLLNSTIDGYTIPSTPVRQFIRKLTAGTAQLRAHTKYCPSTRGKQPAINHKEA